MLQGQRILIVVENLPVPFDRRVWLEATTLTRHGATVTVICPTGKGFTKAREIIEDIEIIRYPIPFAARGALGYAAEFAWCFAATAALSIWVKTAGRGFTLLHACNPPDTFWLLARLWRPAGVRFVFDHHDLCPEMYSAKYGRDGGWLHRALLWLERRSFRTADAVLATNGSHRAIAISRGGRSAADVTIVRSGPDLARFTFYPPEPALRRGKPHLLVYLGEICVQDGVDLMVDAIRLLAQRRQDFHAIFMGGGPHQPSVRDYAHSLGLHEITEFTGRVSDDTLCRVLSSATIGIDPDPKTPWSDQSTMNKVIEYMAFGLPIVAFDLKETRVSAGCAAIYAQPNQARGLADAIDALLDDAPARAAMAAEGRRRVREELSWDHSVQPLLSAYAHALGIRPGHDRLTPRPGAPTRPYTAA